MQRFILKTGRMRQGIELSDESIEWLRQQPAARAITVDAWVLRLAREEAQAGDDESRRRNAKSAVSRILDIQKRVKPDPEGWTIRDYITHGRR